MKRATYNVPDGGMAGHAASTLMHLASQTRQKAAA